MKDMIEIDGVQYQKVEAEDERLRLVIVDNRGLTFIGRCRLDGNDEWMLIRDARCVIYWGTTKHVAELVKGPTTKTQFGLARDVRIRCQNVIAVYDCEEEGWK